MSEDINVVGKVMINSILNSFAMEKWPATQVPRTLRAIEQVEDATIKQENKKENMKTLAGYMVAELKGESKDDSVKDESKLDTFMAQQAEVNAKLLEFLSK